MSTTPATLNLGWSSAWKGVAGGVLMAGFGVWLLVVSVSGLVAGRADGRQAFGVVLGAVLLLVGVLAFAGVWMSRLHMSVDGRGLLVRRRDGGFALTWPEVSTVRLEVEKRWVGRVRLRLYTMAFTLREPRPDLDLWQETDGHRYALGQLGRAGRRLDKALAAHAGSCYQGVRET